jgi:N-acetylmuramoyl-L-alanine amidase
MAAVLGLAVALAVRAQEPAASARRPDGRGATPAVTASLSAVRFVSTPTYTRVMLMLSHEVRFETGRLKADPGKGLPPRLYVDLIGTRLAMDAREPINVDDGVLRQIRVGRFNSDVVRLVLDLTKTREHHIFWIPDPHRLIIDVQGGRAIDPPQKVEAAPAAVARRQTTAPPSGKIRKVVIDPGHGGKDPGAIGVNGLEEKDIVLAVGRKLARRLEREMGIQAILTRTDDTFIPLETRTAIANAEEADLFVSLHVNASPNGDARGLETYYLDNTTDEASIRLAARENATSRKNVSDLQFILSDMTQNLKLEDSITLAHRLQESLVRGLERKMPDVRDLGVKKALFYVLVGARMPSVLVEMFFITNRIEARAMSQESYRDALVDALFEGIQRYQESALASKTL